MKGQHCPETRNFDAPDLSRRDWVGMLGAVGGAIGVAALAACDPPSREEQATAQASTALTGSALANGTYTLTMSVNAGAKSATLAGSGFPPTAAALATHVWVALEPFTANCEVVPLAAGSSGTNLNFSTPLKRSHPQNAPVVILEELRVTPQLFGAVADGTTNDATAIQNAITAALGGGTVVFPPATYAIQSTLSVNNAANLTLIGAGPSSVLKFNLPSPGYGIATPSSPGNVQGLVIRDLSLQGGTNCCNAIAILGGATFSQYCSRITISNVVISGVKTPASAQLAFANAGIALQYVYDAVVEDCTFVGNGFGSSSAASSCIFARFCGQLGSGAYPNTYPGATIHNNRCYSNTVTMCIGVADSCLCAITNNFVTGAAVGLSTSGTLWGYGIYIYNLTGPTSYNVCSDNRVIQTQGTGIYIEGASFTTVRGNIVENTCSLIGTVALAVGGIALNDLSTDCIVANNVVDGTTGDVPRPGIRVDAPNVTISNNRVSNTGAEGIQYNLVTSSYGDLTIIGNTIRNTAGAGIAPSTNNGTIQTAYANLIIANNVIDGTGVSGGKAIAPVQGILCQGPSTSTHTTRLVIQGNVVSGASGDGIFLSATDCFLITQNVVVDSGSYTPGAYAGIHLVGCNNGIIQGNISSNNALTCQGYGVYLSSVSSIQVTENVLLNNPTHGGLVVTPMTPSVSRSGNCLSSAPSQGQATLTAGTVGEFPVSTVTIPSADVQPGDNVLLTTVGAAGTPGAVYVSATSAGTFTIQSTNSGDLSTVFWKVVH